MAKKVLSIGLLCGDVVAYIELYPEEDSDSNCKDQVWTTGGNATNVCKVLKQLGVECTLFASFGDKSDFASQLASKQLISLEVDIQKCEHRVQQSMPTSLILVNSLKGTRTILHCKKNVMEPTFDEFYDKFLIPVIDQDGNSRPPIADYAAVYFEGRNLQETRQMIHHVIKWRTSTSKSQAPSPLILVELEKPNIKLQELVMQGVDLVIIQRDYSMQIGAKNSMEEAVQYFGTNFARNGITSANIICTWGEKGACMLTKDGKMFLSPAYSFQRSNEKSFSDTLGAGDTFTGACLKALVDGISLDDVLKNGCKVAGFKCSVKGFEFPPNFNCYALSDSATL